MNLASSCLNVDTPSEEAAEEGGGALERESLAGRQAVEDVARIAVQNTGKGVIE